MNFLEAVKKGKGIPPIVKKIAFYEDVTSRLITRNLSLGKVVIPHNKKRTIKTPCAIGAGLRTKVNANIGTSTDRSDVKLELEKLAVAELAGADTVMDLSTSKNLKAVRTILLDKTNLPLGTVPIYEIAILGAVRYGALDKIPEDFFIKVLKEQAEEGVDFFTIHAGVTKKTLASLRKNPRIMGIVSRGGAILAEWMLKNSCENPFYRLFDEVVDIAKEFDVTLSLGDGLRPGSVLDATDRPQIEELRVLGNLQKVAFRKNVQVIIEGPGHVPINQIKANVELEKSICNGAPFYVLGPIVTDIAPGYDHITSAIGGAIAGSYGADFLCYVTPSEHLRLPTIDDVKEGVIASKIAAHAADIAKNAAGAIEKDRKISKARFLRDWEKQFEASLDSERCRAYRKSSVPAMKDACTMCGEYCSLKISERCLKNGFSSPKAARRKNRVVNV
ncbi:MAG: phosphomethylpyrimidine synthase ThiC [Candidatus Omnitrophica bacterium]|nr:phosphomethylpyrimidine synthase ThiC [Candidatus Omnitrophota bacterium]